MSAAIPAEYTMAVNAIQAATDRAVGLTFSITTPEMTIPMPITRMPPKPDIRLASWAGKWNWDSRYFGKNVYSPASGSKWSTDDAVRNISMSLLNWRLMVFGKSTKTNEVMWWCWIYMIVSINFSTYLWAEVWILLLAFLIFSVPRLLASSSVAVFYCLSNALGMWTWRSMWESWVMKSAQVLVTEKYKKKKHIASAFWQLLDHNIAAVVIYPSTKHQSISGRTVQSLDRRNLHTDVCRMIQVWNQRLVPEFSHRLWWLQSNIHMISILSSCKVCNRCSILTNIYRWFTAGHIVVNIRNTQRWNGRLSNAHKQ